MGGGDPVPTRAQLVAALQARQVSSRRAYRTAVAALAVSLGSLAFSLWVWFS